MKEPLCTHCGEPIAEKNGINDGWLVVCDFCDTPHYLGADEVTNSEILKQKLKLLNKFTINQTPDGVEIRYRVLNKETYALFFVTIFLFVIIAFFSIPGGEWSVLGIPVSPGPMVIPVFLSIPIAVATVLGYYVVKGFVNRTTVLLMSKRIEILHGPLPGLIPRNQIANIIGRIVGRAAPVSAGIIARNQVIDPGEIEQMYCTQRVALSINDRPVWHVFDVQFRKRSGVDAFLVRGLDTHDQARFIEQGIEHLYQIEDKRS